MSLDDRLAAQWPETPGRDWHAKVEHASKVRGPRYARSSVHHDWAQAIDLPQKYRHLPARRGIHSWNWTWPLPAKESGFKDRAAERAYRQRLVGEPVFSTLAELMAGFAEGLHYLADTRPARSIGTGRW